MTPLLHNQRLPGPVAHQEADAVILHDAADLDRNHINPPPLSAVVTHLGIYGTFDAVHLAYKDLHVNKPLYWADDCGNDPHGLVGGDADAIDVS